MTSLKEYSQQDVPLRQVDQALPDRDWLRAFSGVVTGSLLGSAIWLTVLTVALML